MPILKKILEKIAEGILFLLVLLEHAVAGIFIALEALLKLFFGLFWFVLTLVVGFAIIVLFLVVVCHWHFPKLP